MMDFNERVIPGVSANFLFQEAKARYEFAAQLLKKEMNVLDVGCGTGYGSAILADEVHVLGIDNDQEAIKFAQKRFGQRVNFHLGDAHDLGFNSGTFDLVCAFELVEHLKDPEKFLAEARRVLRNKGKLILSTPNKAVHSPNGKPASPYHLREYTYGQFLDLLKNHFDRVEIFGQRQSGRARQAIADFMRSQTARQGLVDRDALGIRKLLPRGFKERIWRYLGRFYGRGAQSKLESQDFPIEKKGAEKSNYFVAVCQK